MKFPVVFTIVTLLLSISSHGEKPSQSTFVSSNGCFTIDTNLAEKAEVGQYFAFDFQIQSSCIPLKKVSDIQFYATMPAHQHGMNTEPVIEKLDSNTYQVEGVLFHMPGHWKAAFELTYPSKVEVIEVDLNL